MNEIVGVRICSNIIFTKELNNEKITELILRLENEFAQIIKNDTDVDLISGRATFITIDENHELVYEDL